MRSKGGTRAGVAATVAAASVAACILVGVAGAAEPTRPFGLPFPGSPGPGTWYLSQPYGNTVYAFFERRGLYVNGQGLHFGLDFATPCGTPVLAIGDGTVRSVDGSGGSPPHNLAIQHDNGLVSFYGHLLETPRIAVGQRVRRGEPVALSGDMTGTCYSSPHLHLEIRDQSMTRLVNPVVLVDADWHRIVLLGSAPLSFERDLLEPAKWQSIDDQPDVNLGGPLLNQFANAWPSDGW